MRQRESPSVPHRAAQTGGLCSQLQLLNARIVVEEHWQWQGSTENLPEAARDAGMAPASLLNAAGGHWGLRVVPRGVRVQFPCAAIGLG